jgi:glycosyltransferase involved in cell wall biosynthesis
MGGIIYRLPALNPISRDYLTKLDRFFTTHPEYRIVHSHLDCMSGIPLKYAKKHGVPVRIAHAHSSNQTKDAKYLLKLFFKRSIVKYSTHLFACSQAAGTWMFGCGDFHVLNNAIDTASYVYNSHTAQQVRTELGIPKEALVIGHVGRFAPPKNHEFLVRIFANLPETARLLLVGEGELRQTVEQQVEALGIRDRVIFAGLRKDVPRMLQAMDVFVFPSIYEGLPVSIVEAQAAGLPCLISDKVPIECKKTDLVQQIPLDADALAWSTAVLKSAALPRRDTSQEIKAAGFDITENAVWLQNNYLQHWSEVK